MFQVPYRYSVEGKAKIALRSASFGTWLSVTCEGVPWQFFKDVPLIWCFPEILGNNSSCGHMVGIPQDGL